MNNGDFESSTNGWFAGWTYHFASDPNNVRVETLNSPFTNIYSGGTSSARFKDFALLNQSPMIWNTFEEQAGDFVFS
ncbi:MAG: hypothetical protein AAF492_22545, partial [Verrucomicrobiota bacterium]